MFKAKASKYALLTLLAVLFLAAVTWGPSQASAASPPTGKVRLSHNNDAFYAEATSATDWSNVQNYSYNATQGGSVWTITSLGNGKYSLLAAGKALTLNSATDWDVVKTTAYSGWTTQQWTITDLGGGYFKLECNGKALTGDAGGNGVTVKSTPYSGWTTQKWKLTPVDTTGWPSGTWNWVYQNVDRTARLEVESRANVLIIGSTIHDVTDDLGILISNSDTVQIKNTTVRNLTDNGNVYGMGIYLYRSDNVMVDHATVKELVWTGTAFHAHAMHIYGGSGITVKNSQIYNVDGNGITVEADNTNVLIDNNDIYNSGRRPFSSSAPYHGIYAKAADMTIQYNRIHDSLDGSAISMRSTGVVKGNTLTNNKHAAIAYWPDYPKGASGKLDIINNIISQDAYTTTNSKASGIAINYTDGKPADNYFNNFYIDHNQITLTSGNSLGMITCFQATGTWSISNVQVTNNTLTDGRSTPNYLDGETYMSSTSGNTFQ
ncbi:right-handed parallel beta-helix repeat-containing protein [Paenibacillus oryzisoli]|uniref:right-handed parallel beta-helix repeat-containing protein n=1 Tax=Paenibacillus oryzisoli TaxID=1850517 RepID=UPI003D270BB7